LISSGPSPLRTSSASCASCWARSSRFPIFPARRGSCPLRPDVAFRRRVARFSSLGAMLSCRVN
jgi:hypothetical protein